MVRRSGMNRRRFLGAAGAGAAGVVGAAMMGSNVAHATMPTEVGPTFEAIKGDGLLVVGLSPPYSYFHIGIENPDYDKDNVPSICDSQPCLQECLDYMLPTPNVMGFDADMGRVVATAIWGNYKNHIEYKACDWGYRLTGLEAGDFDVLFGACTWTAERDLTYDIAFGPVYYMSDVPILVRTGVDPYHADITQWLTLYDTTGVSLTAAEGKTPVTEYNEVTLVNETQAAVAFAAGGFKVFVGDRESTELVKQFLEERKVDGVPSPIYTEYYAGDATHGPTLSLAPLSAAVRNGDDHWHEVVFWSINLLWLAERPSWAWSKADKTQLLSDWRDKDKGHWDTSGEEPAWVWELPGPKRILLSGLIDGPTWPDTKPNKFGPRYGIAGLPQDWAVNVIKVMGNYNEIYHKTEYNFPERAYNLHALDYPGVGIMVPIES